MTHTYIPSQYPNKRGKSRHGGWTRDQIVTNKERTEKLVKRYTEAGMQTSEIARRLGYASDSISRIKKNLGLTTKTVVKPKVGRSNLTEIRTMLPRVHRIADRRKY